MNADTAALIEAVREPHPWENTPVVDRDDYDALVAACRAVLDEIIGDHVMTYEGWRQAFDNARALREKL